MLLVLAAILAAVFAGLGWRLGRWDIALLVTGMAAFGALLAGLGPARPSGESGSELTLIALAAIAAGILGGTGLAQRFPPRE